MKNFEKRRDRFEFFAGFENPLLNLSFDLEVEDFRAECKAQDLKPFHFFLYCLSHSLNELENFKYRIYRGEVIKIDELVGSYTVLNEENLFNYTRFTLHPELQAFQEQSLRAKAEAEKSLPLLNAGTEVSEREMKNYVFITSIPWLKLTAIEHPVYRYRSADIPSVAWGKFTPTERRTLIIPLSVQAHHGFVDAFHVHQLAELLQSKIKTFTKN